MMDNLSIHRMPKPFLNADHMNEYYIRMKPLRLKGLQSDPSSYISRYESEILEPPKFWHDRLTDHDAHHLIMIRSGEPPSTEPDIVLSHEWVGYVVLIDISKVSAETTKREAFDASTKAADWYMAAIYLDTSVRGRGAGKQLVQAAIDTMRELSRKAGMQASVAVTNVVHGNERALALYQALGFQISNKDAIEEKEGKIHHSTELRISL